MNKARTYALFVARILPDLYELARLLFARHEGDVDRARDDLKSIGDHGAKLKQWEADMKQRMEEAKRERAARDKPPTEGA